MNTTNHWDNFKLEIDKMAHELYQKHAKEVEALTREQFAEAMSQALMSGDFMKYVTIGSQSQQVVYIPFQRQAELEGEVTELKNKLKQVSEILKGMV